LTDGQKITLNGVLSTHKYSYMKILENRRWNSKNFLGGSLFTAWRYQVWKYPVNFFEFW
jgi:hypothetical protein